VALAGQAAARRELVELARSRAQLLRARVLWLGATAPEESLRAAGVRSVQSCRVAEELELEESSLDVVLGPLPATQAGLRVLARALRPGGRWLCALGRDAGLPDYAEELLDARELAWYRERCGLGAQAPRAIPREALDLRSAGFEFTPPRGAGAGAASPALLGELARVHAGWLELAAAGDTCLLLRRGRTITIGELAASAAGA